MKAPPILNEPVPVLLDQPGVKPTDPGLPEHEVILGSAPHGKLGRERLDGSVRNEELCLTFHVLPFLPSLASPYTQSEGSVRDYFVRTAGSGHEQVEAERNARPRKHRNRN